MKSGTVKGQVNYLAGLLTEFVGARQAVMGDGRLSEMGKAEKVRALRDRYYDLAQAGTASLWGKMGDDGYLQGGSVWKLLDQAHERLVAARDGADPLDPVRVDLAGKRLPNVLRRMQMVDDLKEWYELQATSFERRALQVEGANLVLAKWSSQPSAISFVNELERDLEAALHTPDVEAAEEALGLADSVALLAFQVVQRAAPLFGDVAFLGVGTGPFSSILAGVTRDGVGRWAKVQNATHAMQAEIEAKVAAWLDPKQPEPSGETDEEKYHRFYGGGGGVWDK